MGKKIVNAALESRVNAIVSRHAGRSALGKKFGNRAASDKPGFEFRAAVDDEADIFIYDEISSWWGIGANDFVQDLNELSAKTLNIYINSPGGSVFEGYAIYASLMRYADKHGAKINVVVDGWAASIASVIAMAGDHIKIGAHASFMVHQASSIVWGNADEMEEEAAVLREIDDAILDIYVARTGGDAEEIKGWVKAETWFKGQAAVDAGFADEVIPLKTKKSDDEEAKGKPAASADADYFASIFPNMPDDVRAALTKQPENKPGTELPKDKREFAALLRKNGFSRDAADSIAAQGFKPKSEPRDGAPKPEEPTTTDPRDGAEERDIAAAIQAAANSIGIRAAASSLHRP
jgi:ATP-dependent Clp protease protease subunit